MIQIPEPFQNPEEAIEHYKILGDCVGLYDCENCGKSFFLSGFHGVYEFECDCGQGCFLIMNYYSGALYKKEEVLEFLKDHDLNLPDWNNKEWKEMVMGRHNARSSLK